MSEEKKELGTVQDEETATKLEEIKRQVREAKRLEHCPCVWASFAGGGAWVCAFPECIA